MFASGNALAEGPTASRWVVVSGSAVDSSGISRATEASGEVSRPRVVWTGRSKLTSSRGAAYRAGRTRRKRSRVVPGARSACETDTSGEARTGRAENVTESGPVSRLVTRSRTGVRAPETARPPWP